MSKLVAVIILITLLCVPSFAAFVPAQPAPPATPPQAQIRVPNLGGLVSSGSMLKWPDKKVSVDVHDVTITKLAELLTEQTGIQFAVRDGVPKSLKITIQVGNMDVKQFLDTLCSATNLTYIAQSRVKPAKAQDGESPEANKSKIEITAPEITYNQTESGYEMVAPQGQSIVVLNGGIGSPVTNVTLTTLSAEGVIVNMGVVSMSVTNADPVKVATKLINQIPNASYMIMSLEDYIALQDADRAEQVKKAVQVVEQPKVTLALRNTPFYLALGKLAEAGSFYITRPKPGTNDFLIIPGVKVVDNNVMPALIPSSESDVLASTFISLFNTPDMAARERTNQVVCQQYMSRMIGRVQTYAATHDGFLPNGATWITDMPVPHPTLANAQHAYAMNSALSGKKLDSINPKAVLFFECGSDIGQGTQDDVSKVFRHPDGNTYGFVDGHVETRKTVPVFNP